MVKVDLELYYAYAYFNCLNALDPYELSTEGKETVLHWACQCKIKNAELIRKLLETKDR